MNKSEVEIYKSLLACFRYGKANAIKSKDLERMNNINTRQLRKMVELIRRNGVCVCSDEAGYYRPENKTELERYIKRVEATAKSTFYTLRTAKSELQRFEEMAKQESTAPEQIEQIHFNL